MFFIVLRQQKIFGGSRYPAELFSQIRIGVLLTKDIHNIEPTSIFQLTSVFCHASVVRSC